MSKLVPSPAPGGEFLLYQTEDGRTKLEVRFEGETVWLTQKMMAELFQKDVRTINEHLQNIFKEGELEESSVIRKFRITAAGRALRADLVVKEFVTTAADGKRWEGFHAETRRTRRKKG